MRQMIAAVAVAAAGLVTTVAPAQAKLTLLMFEQKGCPYCARWNRDVAPKYGNTEEGATAPLRRIDIHDPLPDGIDLKRPTRFTPTFVLAEDGTEIGRIEGYPGESFFWGLLDRLIAEAPHE